MRASQPPQQRREAKSKNQRHRNAPAQEQLLFSAKTSSALPRQQVKAFPWFVGFEAEHKLLLPCAAPRHKPRTCDWEKFRYCFARAT